MINKWDWQKLQIKEDTDNSESPDLSNNHPFLTDYQKSINILSEIVKDKMDGGLSKDESLVETMGIIMDDIRKNLDLKKGKD